MSLLLIAPGNLWMGGITVKNGHALHLYFGDGKGKTTAAMGLAVRAAGQGRKVLIGQFLKTNTTGEFDSLRKLENVVLALGEPVAGLTMGMSDAEREEEKARQRRNFERICARVEEEKPDVIVLDEFLVAEHLGYLDSERAAAFVEAWLENAEVVLTGRWASEALMARADYATEMVKRKHPYDAGVMARRGIEF